MRPDPVLALFSRHVTQYLTAQGPITSLHFRRCAIIRYASMTTIDCSVAWSQGLKAKWAEDSHAYDSGCGHMEIPQLYYELRLSRYFARTGNDGLRLMM